MAKDPSVKKTPLKRSIFIRILCSMFSVTKLPTLYILLFFSVMGRFTIDTDLNDIYFDPLSKHFENSVLDSATAIKDSQKFCK